MSFDPKQSDAYSQRTSLINTLKNNYEPAFNTLSPLIAFASSRLRDFAAMERELRAAVQAAKDRADAATRELEGQQQDAKRILDEVRRVAAEQGVSQHAVYFHVEGEKHEEEAGKWQRTTVLVAIGLGLYAVLSATVHKWGWLTPTGPYDAFQLGLSKVLIFGVIANMVLLFCEEFSGPQTQLDCQSSPV